MKRFSTCLFVILSIVSSLKASENKQLLDTLDVVLAEKQKYFDEREKRIHEIERKIVECNDSSQCYSLIGEVFSEYKSYNLDTAYHFVKRRLAIAVRANNPVWIKEAQMNLAEVYSITGMYSDALSILNNIRVSHDRLAYYYHIHHATYLQLKEYSFSKAEKDKYSALTQNYIDSLLSVIPVGSFDYDLVKSMQLRNQKKYSQALNILLPYMQNNELNVHTRAMLAENISEIYHLMSDIDNQKKFLIISSINDVKAGVKEFVSLRKLATVLYKAGDVERAYHYIKYSMEASMASNSRFRMLQTAQLLPIIVDSYETELKDKQRRLYYSIFAISVMLLLVFVSTMFIRNQKMKLQRSKKSLDELNLRLQEANENLNIINKSLTESAHVKEEYIGYVFNMCSIYIDKLEEFRKRVNKKLREDKGAELIKLTNSNSLIDDELKEFLHSFDSVFLNLYPNFIEEFNQLLQDDKRISPKQGELLSPEMRIYALVRLGITDSTKIATFLHYSPQTVYNYRLKIRNCTLVSKDDFNFAIQNIGYIGKV